MKIQFSFFWNLIVDFFGFFFFGKSHDFFFLSKSDKPFNKFIRISYIILDFVCANVLERFDLRSVNNGAGVLFYHIFPYPVCTKIEHAHIFPYPVCTKIEHEHAFSISHIRRL